MPKPKKKKDSRLSKKSFAENQEKRNRLAELLTIAAEVEYEVMCQYLFAAFSMKKHPSEGNVSWLQLEKMRRWEGSLMLVARQEMEHLGLVINLLTAIGEAPHLRRPNLPLPADYWPEIDVFTQEPFTEKSVQRFVLFEMPEKLTGENMQFLKDHIPDFAPGKYDGIARLYTEIRKLFEEIDENLLFVGPPSSQFINESASVFSRGINLQTEGGGAVYGIQLEEVDNRSSALKVIKQIMEEGEGAEEEGDCEKNPGSHFCRFLSMYKEYLQELEADPKFRPGRNVVANPITRKDNFTHDRDQKTPITHPIANRMSELFDQCHMTLIAMMVRFFANTDEDKDELLILQKIIFFPIMTTVIRPLGEMLTQMPAFKGDKFSDNQAPKAGPSFDLPNNVSFLPHRSAAWTVISSQLELMKNMAKELSKNKKLDKKMRDRFDLIYQNTARMTLDFNDATGITFKK